VTIGSKSMRAPSALDRRFDSLRRARHLRVRAVHSLAPMHSPDRWLAVLRIVVGLWFVKSLFTKISLGIAWHVVPFPEASDRWLHTMPALISRYAAGNPFPSYKAFLLQTVATHASFAHLTALGEVAIGLSLTMGLFTSVGALFGAVQVVSYGLAVQHTSPGQQGFHIMLLAMMIAFLFAKAGRTLGVDGWVRRHHPASVLARLPLG
jgi:uncharacterized membrane protein YphA (DoxX/SURF4 family)